MTAMNFAGAIRDKTTKSRTYTFITAWMGGRNTSKADYVTEHQFNGLAEDLYNEARLKHKWSCKWKAKGDEDRALRYKRESKLLFRVVEKIDEILEYQ